MKRPDEPVLRFAVPAEHQAHERRHIQIKAASPFGLKAGLEAILLVMLRQTAPVLILKMKEDLTMHYLLRSVPILPPKAGPKNSVALDRALPGALEGRRVNSLPQNTEDLFDVHPRLAGRQMVKQHPLLHRRERVRICNSLQFHLATPITFVRSLIENPCLF